MSFSNFDDINSICIELAEEEEGMGASDQMAVKLYPGQREYPISEHSLSFEGRWIAPLHK
jgi:hypothetical protein